MAKTLPTGRFHLEVSRTASPVDYQGLSDPFREHLCEGLRYEPNSHDLFAFNVAPVIDRPFGEKKIPRKEKKQCFSKVNVIQVNVRPDAEISILGICPRSVNTDRMHLFAGTDVEASVGHDKTYIKVIKKI